MTSQFDATLPPSRHRAAGFTLIELIVTLAILGLALVLVTGYRPPWSGALTLERTADRIATDLRLARSQAIAANHPVAFNVDLAGRQYRVGTAAARLLPGDFSIELLMIADERQGAQTGDIRFNPDGSSTGGRLILASGPRRVAIGVDWLTGRIGVADVP